MTDTARQRAYVVATADEIPPGARKVVDVEGRSIGVFNIDGSYFALRNTCPHAGGPLCLGQVSGLLVGSDRDSVKYLRKGEILRCPWHGWEFDIRTGKSWFDPEGHRVKAYDARRESGQALLEGELELIEAGMAEGPHQAETYRVTRDGEYIIVEL